MSKKKYDDDDGRIVADMSGVDRQPLLLPRFGNKNNESNDVQSDDDVNKFQMSSNEKRSFIAGALGAALAVAGVFAVVGAIVIFLITRMG
ncbi:MAG: hypothetical protein E7571_06740 [Ruminococcaceae bacterium]|jgi:preprotein translocase subunit SecF|nr:hypothetical protein [Oscillospiraceae bacterium]